MLTRSILLTVCAVALQADSITTYTFSASGLDKPCVSCQQSFTFLAPQFDGLLSSVEFSIVDHQNVWWGYNDMNSPYVGQPLTLTTTTRLTSADLPGLLAANVNTFHGTIQGNHQISGSIPFEYSDVLSASAFAVDPSLFEGTGTVPITFTINAFGSSVQTPSGLIPASVVGIFDSLELTATYTDPPAEVPEPSWLLVAFLPLLWRLRCAR